MVFLVYYPRMKGVRTCLSGLTPETVMKLSNIDQVQKYVFALLFSSFYLFMCHSFIVYI